MNFNFSHSLIKYYYKNLGLSYLNSVQRENNIKLLFIKILEKKNISVFNKIIELFKKNSGYSNKSIYNKNTNINNYYIKKGFSYIEAVEREKYLSLPLLNRFINKIILSKLKIIIHQFKNNFHYLKLKNIITKFKKNKMLNTTIYPKSYKLDLISKKKKLDTNIEIGTYRYFYDKYINNKYTKTNYKDKNKNKNKDKDKDRENEIIKLTTNYENNKITRRHSVCTKPSNINSNKSFKQNRRFSMIV